MAAPQQQRLASAAPQTLARAPPVSSMESKGASSMAPPPLARGRSLSSGVGAAAMAAGTKRRSVALNERHEFPQGRYDRGEEFAAPDRGFRTKGIRPSLSDSTSKVTRTYRSSDPMDVYNTSGVNFTGGGFSLVCEYDPAQDTVFADVYLGAPQIGTGTPTNTLFQNLTDEWQHFSNVFRYWKVTKFQMFVNKLPRAVYTPSQPVPGVPTNQQQGGTWTGSMGDPGVFLMRPWSGQPDQVDYKTGLLTATDFDDHNRMKIKKVETAQGGTRPMSLTVAPLQPYFVPTSNSTNELTSDLLKFQRTPAIDMANAKVVPNINANSYGIIFMWYFPSCALATTGFLASTVWFEIEIEYFGLDRPSAYVPPPLADGQVYAGSRQQLAAIMSGTDVTVVDRPKPPPRKYHPGLAELQGLVKPVEQKTDDQQNAAPEAESPLVTDDYVEVPQKAAAAPVVKSGLPGSRPNTPKR